MWNSQSLASRPQWSSQGRLRTICGAGRPSGARIPSDEVEVGESEEVHGFHLRDGLSRDAVYREECGSLIFGGGGVRVLVRDPVKACFPAGVSVVQGSLIEVDSLRGALSGVSTLFLLNAVEPEEFTQALIALNLAHEAGIERTVYLSVIHSDTYVQVPHFAGKFGVERMIEGMGLNATILRPACFIQNNLTIVDVVSGHGVYPMSIGSKGPAMVDAREIGEVAAIELARREIATGSLPLDRINVVGPETLTGTDIADIWSEVLARPIAYGGDDTDVFEQNLRNFMPNWMAFDMRLLAERFLTDGMLPEAGDVARLTTLLGRPLRSYRDFVAEVAASA